MYYVRYEFSELRSAAEHDLLLVAFPTSYGSIYSFLPPSDRRGYVLASAVRLLAASPDVADDGDTIGIAVCHSLAEVESVWADTDVDVLVYSAPGGLVTLGYLEDGYRRLSSTGEYYLLRHFLTDFADYE